MSLRSMLATIILVLPTFCSYAWAQFPTQTSISSDPGITQALKTSRLSPVSKLEGVQFINNSTSQILLERNGKRYLVDTQNKTIQEVIAETNTAAKASSDSKGEEPAQASSKEKKEEKEVYYTEDINLWTLPTTHHLEKKALIVDFTHRFAYEGEAFRGQVMNNLFGLD